MSHFIPKKTLTEGMAANPLDHQVSNDNDVTKLAQEGILTAIAAETDAINQYTQIADLVFQSEPWFKEKATPVIDDIVAEEKKHLGQLTEFMSNLPAFEKEMKAGEEETETGEHKEESDTEEKEEAKESVEQKTYPSGFDKYDADIIFDLLENKYHVNVTEDFVMDHNLELYADEVDEMLAELNIDPNILPEIENDIINTANIEKNNAAKAENERLENIQHDLDILKRLTDFEDEICLKDVDIRDKIYDLISEIKYASNSENN